MFRDWRREKRRRKERKVKDSPTTSRFNLCISSGMIPIKVCETFSVKSVHTHNNITLILLFFNWLDYNSEILEKHGYIREC